MSIDALHIRRAGMNDADLLLNWRNDEETREQSRSQGLINRESHLRWLESSLKNLGRTICIAEFDGQPIGMVRADERSDGFTEISYSIAPEVRGKGFGKLMVQNFVREYLSGKRIVASIKKGHVPSESVAKALGLAPYSETASDDASDRRPVVEWR